MMKLNSIKKFKLEDIISTPDDNDIGYFIEVDLRYTDNKKEETKNFPFCPENKSIHRDENNDSMKKLKRETFTKVKKLICDWTDKKNYSVHNRMIKLCVRHSMIVYKIHEIFSLEQSKWLEKYINFYKQKRNKRNIVFGKDFYKLLNNAFYRKTMENVRNRLRLEIVIKMNIRKL